MIKDIEGYNPLPENVYISPSDIHGMGIFAKQTIPLGHDFGITHVSDSRFPNGYIRTPFGGFINHSFTPNCELAEVEDTIHIKTLAKILKGTELTVDYRPYYSKSEIATYH